MKKAIFTFITLSLTLLFLAACGTSTSQGTPTPAPSTSATLIAEGKLMPLQSLDESFTVSGDIAELLVSDGETVTSGQVLAHLSNSANAELALAQAEQEALSASQALDEIKNSSLANSNASLNLAQAQSKYNSAYNNYQNSTALQGSSDLIASTRAQLVILDNRIANLEETYTNQAELSDDDPKKAQTLKDLSQTRIDREKINNLLNYYSSNPNALDVQTLKAEFEVAKSRLADAQRVYDRMKDGIDPNLLGAAEARVKTADAAVKSAQAALDALQLTAGIDGIVADISVIPGQQVSPGQVVLTVADFTGWIIKTDNLTESDIVNVEVGQAVEVVFDALPDVTLKGTVTHINDRFEEVRGDVTYTVTIKLEETDPRMRWGMTAAIKFLK